MENSKQGTGADSYVVYDMQQLGHPTIIGEHDMISSIVTDFSKQTSAFAWSDYPVFYSF